MPDAEGPSFFYVLNEAIRILYVDDDPILREFATVHLASDHAEVTLAEDGLAALRLLDRESFDIVLLDLEMPRVDGFEVLQVLRRSARGRNLPVIVVTGREDVLAIDMAFRQGATSFVVKPINWRLLSYQMKYVLRAHRLESARAELQGQG